MKKTSHHVVTGTIELLSGMRVGGSDDMLQIGGSDLTCIRDAGTGLPYIPGSSLKGKMRSGLERFLGVAWGKGGAEPCGCAAVDCPICRVFGPHKQTKHNLGPTRIIVRDAAIRGEFSIENKTEATIRRDTGAAEHPRSVERIAKGAKFDFRIDFQTFDIDADFTYTDADEKPVQGQGAIQQVLEHAVSLLEETNIGSGGSKGYGQIHIYDLKVRRLNRRGFDDLNGDQPGASA